MAITITNNLKHYLGVNGILFKPNETRTYDYFETETLGKLIEDKSITVTGDNFETPLKPDESSVQWKNTIRPDGFNCWKRVPVPKEAKQFKMDIFGGKILLKWKKEDTKPVMTFYHMEKTKIKLPENNMTEFFISGDPVAYGCMEFFRV